jgi:hypothetical protein
MRFTDLPDTYWAYGYISYLYCRGVVGGYPDGTFRPGEGSTRGQFAKMLVLSQDWILYNPVNPTFSDVPPGSTFYTYVETAAVRQVIGGYPDGTFKVNNPVTRGQAAKMLVLARSWSLYTPTNPSFSDVPQSHWAYGYVETALIHSIVSGSPDGLFRPDTLVNRGQLAKMVALTAQAPRGVPGSESPTAPSAPTMHVAAPPKETAAP